MANNYRPISPELLAQLSRMGRRGDTMLAHINPEEAALLKKMGGSGTINPATGLPEFAFSDDSWGYVNRDGGDGGFESEYDFGGDFGGGSDYDYGGGGFDPDPIYTPDPVIPVDDTPVDTGPSAADILAQQQADALAQQQADALAQQQADAAAAAQQAYWDQLAAQQQADWQAQADAQAAEWQRQADERDRLANEANQAEWQRQADAQAARDLQAQLDAAASVIPGNSTLINNYVDNLSGSINNGVSNVVTIPVGGTTNTDLLNGYVPTESSNITDTTGLDTGPVIPNITTGGTGTTIDTTGGTTGAVSPVTSGPGAVTSVTGGTPTTTGGTGGAIDPFAPVAYGTGLGGENLPGAFGDTIPQNVIDSVGPDAIIRPNADGTYQVFDNSTGQFTNFNADGTAIQYNSDGSVFNPRVDVRYIDPKTGQIVDTSGTTLGGLAGFGTGSTLPDATTTPAFGTGSSYKPGTTWCDSPYSVLGFGDYDPKKDPA